MSTYTLSEDEISLLMQVVIGITHQRATPDVAQMDEAMIQLCNDLRNIWYLKVKHHLPAYQLTTEHLGGDGFIELFTELNNDHMVQFVTRLLELQGQKKREEATMKIPKIVMAMAQADDDTMGAFNLGWLNTALKYLEGENRMQEYIEDLNQAEVQGQKKRVKATTKIQKITEAMAQADGDTMSAFDMRWLDTTLRDLEGKEHTVVLNQAQDKDQDQAPVRVQEQAQDEQASATDSSASIADASEPPSSWLRRASYNIQLHEYNFDTSTPR